MCRRWHALCNFAGFWDKRILDLKDMDAVRLRSSSISSNVSQVRKITHGRAGVMKRIHASREISIHEVAMKFRALQEIIMDGWPSGIDMSAAGKYLPHLKSLKMVAHAWCHADPLPEMVEIKGLRELSIVINADIGHVIHFDEMVPIECMKNLTGLRCAHTSIHTREFLSHSLSSPLLPARSISYLQR
jgi:hypothetical protein